MGQGLVCACVNAVCVYVYVCVCVGGEIESERERGVVRGGLFMRVSGVELELRDDPENNNPVL